MNRLRLYLLALAALFVCSVKADEGMWLLQLMQQQHSIDMMKKQGLKLEAQDLYNPNGISLKDAVGIFGGGCTGEIISPEGLILTNHHCGYASIQQHSSVEHDYLTDGYFQRQRAPYSGTEIYIYRAYRRYHGYCQCQDRGKRNHRIRIIQQYIPSKAGS